MALLKCSFLILALSRCYASDQTTEPPIDVTEMAGTPASCDFDRNNFCSWIPTENDLQFKINIPHKTKDRMPKFDHTKGNYLGRYAYVQGDNVSKKEATLNLSTDPSEFKGGFCFSFWYIMEVEGESRLRVQASESRSKEEYVTYWSRKGNYGYRWRHAYIYIKTPGLNMKMRITAEVTTGVIAIDDLDERQTLSCPPAKICTFDGGDGMCDCTQDASNTLDWDIKSGEDNSTINRMPDHTTQSMEGSYLYVGYFGNVTTSQLSRIYSNKPRESSGGKCVTFYYHIYNVSKLSFNAYLVIGTGISDPQWTMSISQGLLWHGARFSFSAYLRWQVAFEVNVERLGYGQVAIDDISITDGRCPDPGYCDFDSEDCLWENVRPPFDEKNIEHRDAMHAEVFEDLLKDDFDWIRHIGEDYFGPPKDKTQGSPQGFYLLLDPRYASDGQKAVYVSERLKASPAVCLKMWYATPNYKDGASLKVLSSSDFLSARQEKLINTTTNEEWTEVLVSIIPEKISNSPVLYYWIFLAGYVGNHRLGYIAIDDIRIKDGVCEETPELFNCGNGQQVLMKDVCNFYKDCANGKDELNCADCDFETNTCGWKAPQTVSPYKWVRSRGTEKIPMDHTKEDSSGYFMIASATADSYYDGLTAYLQTGTLKNAFSTCSMKFWYNLLGPGQLAVNLTKNSENIEIWLPSEKSNQLWTLGEAFIGRIASSFQISLVARSVKGEATHAAVDDIIMRECETLTTGVPGRCYSDQFNCKNLRCIPENYICDYTDDCGNFEDETAETCENAASRCNFDQSFCGWISENTSAQFQRRSPFSALDQGPTRDHTTGSGIGGFLYLGSRVRPTPARILGPLLWAFSNGKGCQMRFYYDIRGNGPLSLQIKTRKEDDRTERVVWTREDPTEGYSFIQERVTFEDEWDDFQVIIEASITTSSGRANYIALDDISFNHLCMEADHEFKTVEPFVTSPLPIKRCEITQFSCKTGGQCIPMELKCNFQQDCADGSDEDHCGKCDFHEDMCGLINIGSDSNFKWERVQAEKYSFSKDSTAPKTDSQNDPLGYFVVLSSKNYNSANTSAIMRTPVLEATSPACKIEFFYHFNVREGDLELYVSEIGVGQKIKKFSRTTNAGTEWQFASVPIGGNPRGKVIEYHGFVNQSPLLKQVEEIAIDHINYVTCDSTIIHTEKPKRTEVAYSTTEVSKKTTLPQGHCEKGHKLCNDRKQCIPGLLFCDGVRDCEDGSDELYGCDEASLCGEGFYFCKDRAFPPCIHREKICDGINHCRDGSDESLCDECPNTFCQNGGHCSIHNRKLICTCEPSFYHNRCIKRITPPEPEDRFKSLSLVGWIISIVLGVILLIAIICCMRRANA